MKEDERRLAEGLLFTDLYQLTMAQLYFRLGLHERRAQFDHFFRRYPDYGTHQAGYCVNAGLEWLLDWMARARCGEEELARLRGQTGRGGTPLFQEDFLAWLRDHGNFAGISLRAVPEGRVVHPQAPLTTVEGPLAMVQILESPLLNQLNYQTLIATKAARIHQAGRGGTLVEFGMRRAQERGANAGVRAALIGGAAASSNTGISYVLGYPPKGTHAHSMVQAFIALGEGELGAFRAYAEVYPDDCLLLVDTVNTLESGLPNAIRVFEELRRRGHEPVGIRLDSGDLAYLSIQAAKMLDQAGFADTVIVLSNELDEMAIKQIVNRIAAEAGRRGVDPDRLVKRLVYGVGTRLIVSQEAAALDGVYKLVALREQDQWRPAIKISESPRKILNPGRKQVWRLYDRRGLAMMDLVGGVDERPGEQARLVCHHPFEPEVARLVDREEISALEPLLIEVLREGRRVAEPDSLEEMRRRRGQDLARLDQEIKRLVKPRPYQVSLSEELWRRKQELIERLRPGPREEQR